LLCGLAVPALAYLAARSALAPRTLALWITGELFGWLNQNGGDIETLRVAPEGLAELLGFLERGEINMATAKTLLGDMLVSGQSAAALIQSRGLRQISDSDVLAALVRQALEENPAELQSYLSGKETLANWFFGQVMRAARGQGNPQVIRAELERQLAERKQAAS
jgi:aspartyl-tRNA(Asn)/glutamyl-tRNA(Gln) amidotransferase subunit B